MRRKQKPLGWDAYMLVRVDDGTRGDTLYCSRHDADDDLSKKPGWVVVDVRITENPCKPIAREAARK